MFQCQTGGLAASKVASPRDVAMWTRVLSRALFLSAELGRDDVASSVLSFLMRAKQIKPSARSEDTDHVAGRASDR